MKRKLKTKRSHNKLAKNSIQACLFPSCAPPKKGNRKSFFFVPQMCKTKKKCKKPYKTIYVNFLFIKQKEGINVLQNGGGKIPNNFQSHRKNLAPQTPTQSQAVRWVLF